MKPSTKTNVNEIATTFANAVQAKNTSLIASILADDGKFETQDSQLDTIEHCSKAVFLAWVETAISETSIFRVEHDQCLHCKIGNPVLLFNDGKFPPVKKEMANISMNGLMLDIQDGLISEIKFCYTFLGRENKYQHECISPLVDELTDTGIPLMKAIDIIMVREGYRDARKTKD